MSKMGWLCTVVMGAAVATAAAGCDVMNGVANVHAAEAEGTFERSLTVTGPVELDVRTNAGDIQVRAGTDGRVHVIGRIRVSGGRLPLSDNPQKRVDRIKADPPVTQTGNTLHVGNGDNNPIYQNVSISYEVVVPATTKIVARSGSGDIGIAMDAAGVEARTGSGDINILGASGGFLAQTGSGDVHAGRVAGAMEASTGSGDIDAVQTTPGPVQMQTGAGDVTLKLPKEAGFTVRIRTGSGSITTTPPVAPASSRRRNRVDGAVRGGGPLVDIKTGSGDVTVK